MHDRCIRIPLNPHHLVVIWSPLLPSSGFGLHILRRALVDEYMSPEDHSYVFSSPLHAAYGEVGQGLLDQTVMTLSEPMVNLHIQP